MDSTSAPPDSGIQRLPTLDSVPQRRLLGFCPPGTASATRPWSYLRGEPSTCSYRLKFALGSAESRYSETKSITTEEDGQLVLPLLMRGKRALADEDGPGAAERMCAVRVSTLSPDPSPSKGEGNDESPALENGDRRA